MEAAVKKAIRAANQRKRTKLMNHRIVLARNVLMPRCLIACTILLNVNRHTMFCFTFSQ
jgi:hypothetical protein